MMDVREALEKRRWFMALRIGGDRESAVKDIERALRSAYFVGWSDGTGVGNSDNGVTAFVTAAMEDK